MSDIAGEYVPGSWDWVNNQVEKYEASGGREANTIPGSDRKIIVVTMRGARTGKVRKIALMRVEHGGEYALVASKGGTPTHPGWYNNLITHPDEVTVQDGPEPFPVTIREVHGAERQLWWDRAVEAYVEYAEYQQKTDRVIPVVVATPN